MHIPAVSVIMNCLNSSRDLREALDSLMAQTFTDFPCPANSRRVAIIGGGAAAVAAAETAQANGWQAIIVDPRDECFKCLGKLKKIIKDVK